jgi:hypothetical protein
MIFVIITLLIKRFKSEQIDDVKSLWRYINPLFIYFTWTSQIFYMSLGLCIVPNLNKIRELLQVNNLFHSVEI